MTKRRTKQVDSHADSGQNTGLWFDACPNCAHPVSGRTRAALEDAAIAHEQWHWAADAGNPLGQSSWPVS